MILIINFFMAVEIFFSLSTYNLLANESRVILV